MVAHSPYDGLMLCLTNTINLGVTIIKGSDTELKLFPVTEEDCHGCLHEPAFYVVKTLPDSDTSGTTSGSTNT